MAPVQNTCGALRVHTANPAVVPPDWASLWKSFHSPVVSQCQFLPGSVRYHPLQLYSQVPVIDRVDGGREARSLAHSR